MDFFRRQNWNIIGKSWLWFTISGIVLLGGVVAWATMGLNKGIDFAGGTIVTYSLGRPVATTPSEEVSVIGQIRDALRGMGIERSEILVAGGDHIYIRTYAVANDEEAAARDKAIQEALDRLYGQQYGPITWLGRETVGPVVGAELRSAALRAVIIGELLILIYVWVRYQFWFGLAAILALAHDVLATTGTMALFRIELNSWYVAVILTVVGYSVNDSVVIFDRIRENRGRHRHAPLGPIVNASLLETMARSINTVLTVVFTLTALLMFGGPVIHGFALAMLVGIGFGTYSSIFIAAPLVVMFDNWARRRTGRTVVTPAYSAATVAGPSVSPAAPEAEVETEEEKPRVSAAETMRRAAEAAQDEKRQLRRLRRAKKRAKRSKGKG
ncbi:MAG: protein translocase subunit SecF [Armatimonadetes bacterium]|nr:protein translocase subunit SecF [Armatimonadota bacterium]